MYKKRDKYLHSLHSMFCRLTGFVYMQNETNPYNGNTNEYIKQDKGYV